MGNAVSSITLCKVPISPTHQIDFSSKTEQFEYFRSNAKYTYEKCNYQARKGTMRVKGYVDKLKECNYGYYTNTYNGTSKTYYFWIVQKNFLARETTELTIQIDVFQTWLFDIYFKPCFIERCHTKTDNLDEHTLPEDFELGNYVATDRKAVECLQGNPCFFVAITDVVQGALFGKTYSGYSLYYFDFEDRNEMTNLIQQKCDEGHADAIAFIFSFPKGLIRGNFSSGDCIVGSLGTESQTFDYGIDDRGVFKHRGKSYIPYNNKLLTYPYNFITVKNSSGGNIILKWEDFDQTGTLHFKIEGVLTQNPTITMTPKNYCGKEYSYEDSISMRDFGLCSWNNDNYGNWLAQHSNTISAQSKNAISSFRTNSIVAENNYNNALSNRDTQMYKGAINTMINTAENLGHLNFLGAIGSGVGGGANTYLDYKQNTRNANNDLENTNLLNTTNYQNTIRSLTASVQDAQVQPNTCKGDTSSCGLDVARDSATFFIENTKIKPEYAKIIDMYFQMYGYQVNTVERPNFKTREKWNYIKTVNCNVYGTVPHEDLQAIDQLFNNGLTIWHDESYMFNYDTKNEVK